MQRYTVLLGTRQNIDHDAGSFDTEAEARESVEGFAPSAAWIEEFKATAAHMGISGDTWDDWASAAPPERIAEIDLECREGSEPWMPEDAAGQYRYGWEEFQRDYPTVWDALPGGVPAPEVERPVYWTREY